MVRISGMRTIAPSLFLAFSMVGCGAGEPASAQDMGPQQEVHESLGITPAAIDTALASRLSRTFRAAASRALPAVVYITVIERKTVARGQQQTAPWFRWFFGDPDAPRSAIPQEPRERTRQGQGSGFIFDERGYILTNNHVVEGADRVRVRLMDGREFEAEVVGRDPSTDIAVIKIAVPDDEDLPVAPLSDNELRIGDWVLALGNPLGLDFSVTAGIVSAKGRQLDGAVEARFGAAALQSFIQTDAAINPGNSGGPLVNLRGEVVGVNTAIVSRNGFFAGAGFAIPINLVSEVAKDLIEYGEVRRARMGIYIRPVGEADAALYGLDRIHGALISGVPEGSPADEAGVQAGDVVLAIDGESIESATELQAYIARQTPGEEITVALIRRGERTHLEVELGEFQGPSSDQPDSEPRRSAADLLGFSTRTLTDDMASRVDLPPGGAVIVDVERYSAAARAGLGRGMVIVWMNGSTVEAAEDLEAIAEDIEPGDIVSLRVRNPRLPDAGEMVINFRTRS